MKTLIPSKKLLLVPFFLLLGVALCYGQNEMANAMKKKADTAFNLGNYSDALEWIRKYVGVDGSQTVATAFSTKCKQCIDFNQKAQEAYGRGSYASAKQYYEDLKRVNPNHPNIQVLIANCQERLQQQVSSTAHSVPAQPSPTQTSSSVQSAQAPVKAATVPESQKPTSSSYSTQASSYSSQSSSSSTSAYSTSSSGHYATSSYRRQSPFSPSNDNDVYFAWDVVGVGYPSSLITGFQFRYGGILGVGAYLNFGMDFTRVNVNEDEGHTTFIWPHIQGGIKLYAYRGLFVGVGYGFVAPAKCDMRLLYSVPTNNYDRIEHGSARDAIRERVPWNHGPQFMAGYDWALQVNNSANFFMGVDAGISMDVVEKYIDPYFGLRIGVAWLLN